MDSGNNSDSIQSSSGDEDYDSRSESAPPPPFFLNPHHYQNQQLPTFFNIPSSNNYLHSVSQSQSHQHNSNPSSFLNLDSVGSITNNKNLQGSSSYHHQGGLVNHGSSSSSSMQPRLLIKNPKKRTRTSRKAPTTVLTTDTSNFRAMVQEFTGIPAQPFSVGSPYSRRLDLFKSGNNLEPMGPLNYHLRPATQKFQPIPGFVSSSIDATTTTSTTSHNHNGTTSDYQLLSDLGLNNNKEPQNMLNNFIMQQNLNHPLVSFQSLLQQSNLNPSLNVTGAIFGANKSLASNFVQPSFEDHHHLAMSHAHVGLPNQQDHHSRPFEGYFGNSSHRVTSCKLNYSASSSDFHHDKNLENVSSRGEVLLFERAKGIHCTGREMISKAIWKKRTYVVTCDSLSIGIMVAHARE